MIPHRIGAIDALYWLLETRRQSTYGVPDGRAGARLELTGHDETLELAAQCRELLYPNQKAGRQ